MIKENELKKGYRNAYILTLLGILYIISFLGFAIYTNYGVIQQAWDMGGTPFVPASAIEADGYHVDITQELKDFGHGPETEVK